jgi:ubiquinone/menaquinone biosynthesis C-methylase UbiE
MMEITGERLFLGHMTARTENEHLARYRFAMELVRGKRVADIACGSGYGTQILASAGARSVHGMDISEEAVEFARTQYNASNATYSVANAQELTTISDGEFDVVVSFETIEHLQDVEAYLDEMKRILRPGGVFVVSTPDRRLASLWYWYFGHPKNPYHAREYTERELLDLLSTRFQIKACYGQAFVPQWLVFWPVQYIIKVFRGIFNTAKVRAFRDNLYSNGGNCKVVPKEPGTGVPNYWVISCVRQEK